MAKREAQARSLPSGEEMPAALTSAAEEHAQALRDELLKSTERAAKTFVGQARAEGERHIEMAGRRAQAIAESMGRIEEAEQALGARAQAFAEASKALRAELASFASALAEGEARLRPQTTPSDEPDLRLVASPAPEPMAPEAPATGISQFLFTAEPDPVDDVEAEVEAEGTEEELDEDDDDEDEPRSEEDDGPPPTPEQIRQFFREAEEAEIERAARRERLAAESQRGWFRRFFSAPDAPPDPEEPPAAEDAPAIDDEQEEAVVRARGRDRLYTDIGGAIIGLSGAAALLNFVILK